MTREQILQDLVPEADAAEAFGVSVHGLRGWRKRGYGPPATKIGRKVFYKREAIERFVREADAKSR